MATRFNFPIIFVLCGYSFVSIGCGGDDTKTDPCVTLPATCAPAIDPTYTQIYEQILSKRCGSTDPGGSCHGPNGRQGGLGLYDANGAFDDLTGVHGRARVEPENPECSVLMARLASDDPNYRMPYRGTKLDAGLLCAVQLWIKNGAMK